MSCKGLHCSGCSHGGRGAGALAVVVVLIVIVAAIARPVIKAADEAGHVLEIVLEVVLVGLAVVAGIAALAVLGWAGFRIYRWQAARRAQAVPAAIQVHAEVLPDEPRAIEPPKARAAGVDDLISEHARSDAP